MTSHLVRVPLSVIARRVASSSKRGLDRLFLMASAVRGIDRACGQLVSAAIMIVSVLNKKACDSKR